MTQTAAASDSEPITPRTIPIPMSPGQITFRPTVMATKKIYARRQDGSGRESYKHAAALNVLADRQMLRSFFSAAAAATWSLRQRRREQPDSAHQQPAASANPPFNCGNDRTGNQHSALRATRIHSR